MKLLNAQVQIIIDNQIFLKDPESSDIGRAIIKNSIELIDEIGIEAFTFKKLGQRIGSPESTIYRYFENKHRILLYLISWYWSWLEYRLVFATANVKSNETKLKRAIEILTSEIEEDLSVEHINEVILNRLVISESFKAYHIKEVDSENKVGLYKPYKRLVQRVVDMVLAIQPKFKCPHMLVTTIVEGAHHQRFFAEHLPSLTNSSTSKNKNEITKFYTELTFAMLTQ